MFVGMEGSTPIRLRAYLTRVGVRPAWLAEQVGISRSHMSAWLHGDQPVPDRHRHTIIRVLRERQLERIGPDLFNEDQEGLS